MLLPGRRRGAGNKEMRGVDQPEKSQKNGTARCRNFVQRLAQFVTLAIA
jgi:hypothetical protein